MLDSLEYSVNAPNLPKKNSIFAREGLSKNDNKISYDNKMYNGNEIRLKLILFLPQKVKVASFRLHFLWQNHIN